ncbi:MAG: ABC transporter permease [Weeksellaceae bacterium]|nr:ABC transporter permease [Weeksellaceae bacterium]
MADTAFYIAKRYLIAKKGSTAVTFITWLAAIAMMVAVAAMFIIISVFSGLEDLNRDLISNLHADLTIKSREGKVLKDIGKLQQGLSKNGEIAGFSKAIEEKVYIDYAGKGDIAFLRGVDSAYISVNPVNKNIFYGTYPDFKYPNEVVMENQLGNRLSIPVGSQADFATIFMPRAGKGLINKEEDIFNKKDIYVTGVFSGNDQLNSYIIAPIALAQQLLDLPDTAAYQILIKLKNSENADAVRDQLLAAVGKEYLITTKKEENAAFWKMINIEKLFIYFIFVLVIFITTFNLAGAIIILQLDKKQQARSLLSLGLPISELRKTYFYTGILIVITGIAVGLILGTVICFIQLQTGFFKANAAIDLAFPVRILPMNYLIVAATAAAFGILISWIFSKINRQYITNS